MQKLTAKRKYLYAKGSQKNDFFGYFSLILIVSLVLPFWPNQVLAKPEINPQRYTVKFSNPQGLNKLTELGISYTKRFAFINSSAFSNIYSFSSALPLEILEFDLRPDYEYLQNDYQLTEQTVDTNDPGFTENPLNIDKEWALPKVGFTEVWGKTTGTASNIVAVLDTGIDATHEDLQSINFVDGFNFLSSEKISGKVNSDDNGHGTLVAGILGATPNNNLGIVGTNWSISLMPLKVLDSDGKGDVSSISEAIVWAADHNANIINLSLGGIGFGHDTTLANAISYAFNKNIVVVAAAGNDVAANGDSLDNQPVYPICDDNGANMVIGVTATDQNDLKPPFANYGKNCIDVSAPGKRILSTINHDPFTKAVTPNAYAYASGTSMAAAFVSGEAAIIRSLYPEATNVQIRDRIIASADPIGKLNLSQCGGNSCLGLLGSGRINAEKSVESQIIPQNIIEGDLVKVQDSGFIYYIYGGQKNLVSPFVYNQRFQNNLLRTVPESQLDRFPEGAYALPLEGTLVKFDNSPTVYVISQGKKDPVTLQIFKQYGYQFSQVNTLSFSELNSWITGNFYPPKEGSLVKTPFSTTVYWVVGRVLHPASYNFYRNRGLNIFPILIVNSADLQSLPKGEAYIE